MKFGLLATSHVKKKYSKTSEILPLVLALNYNSSLLFEDINQRFLEKFSMGKV